MLVGDFTDSPHVQDVAREVGSMGADDGLRIGANEAHKIPIIHPALPVCRDEVHGHVPLLAQGIEGAENGIVL